MEKMKAHLQLLVEEAVAELSFTYQLNIERDSFKQQAELLAQRSTEQVNAYLSTRAYQLRQMCGKVRAISPEELYVVASEDAATESMEYAYLHGRTYYDPRILLPTSDQVKEMWQYMLTLPKNYAWGPFQDFFEKMIVHTLRQLNLYEEMLDKEIIGIDYALQSFEGEVIHTSLCALAERTLAGLRTQAGLFKRSNAPAFLLHENMEKLGFAKTTLHLLQRAKPAKY